MMNFPQIHTHRLELKEIVQADRNAIFDIFSNVDVVKYYDLAAFQALEQADKLIAFFRKRFEEAVGIRWGIYFKGHNRCLGTCGFNSWDKNMRSATIGYDLNKDYWGQGLMTEALYAVVETVFSQESPFGEFNRIQADTVPGNIASEKLLLKLGFKEEGLRRESGFWKNQYHDLKCFGLIRSEFKKR
jgi:ribosomal-protein-alanine N-acetyltransferase